MIVGSECATIRSGSYQGKLQDHFTHGQFIDVAVAVRRQDVAYFRSQSEKLDVLPSMYVIDILLLMSWRKRTINSLARW